MSYILRPYQEETVTKAVEYLKKVKIGKHGIVVVPVGAGKSLIQAAIVHRLKEPCLIFQPNKEILEQNLSKMDGYGIKAAVYSASMNRKETGEVTLATIGSVKNTPQIFEHVKYCLIDECHLVSSLGGMYHDFFHETQRRGVKFIGLTATPYRMASNSLGTQLRWLTRTRPKIFTDVVHVVQSPDLWKGGFLCPLEYKVVNSGFDSRKLSINTTGANYTDDSVRRHFKDLGFDDQIVKCVERLWHYGRKNAVVFTPFIENARYVASKIPNAAFVSSETPNKERKDILNAFKAGEIRVLTNVGIVSIGFDYPALDSVVLARPTMSLAVYVQHVGRGVRTAPGKKSTFIVDMVGLKNKFGRVEDMAMINTGRGKWAVSNCGRQLTNVVFQ